MIGAVSGCTSAETAIDPNQPNHGKEKGHGGELLQGLHPAAGARQLACRAWNKGQREIWQRKPKGSSHQRCSAGRCYHRCEDTREERAGITAFAGEIVSGVRQSQTEVK